MKRFFTMIVAACAIFAASAQFPMVTLSHDGELTFFSNISGLEDALTSAQDGDIVYLSEGNFTSNKETIVVDKRISIIGSGYSSQILCGIKVYMVNNQFVEGQSFNIDGVSLKELSFDTGTGVSETNNAQRNNIGYTSLSNSRIYKIVHAGLGGKELFINSCYIDVFDPYAVSENNTLITNSKIFKITDQSHDSTGASMTLINCNVWGSYSFPSNVISSIIEYPITNSGEITSKFSSSGNTMNAIHTLIADEFSLPNGVTTHNCYFGYAPLDDYLDYTGNDLMEYLGQDGKVVGIHGGDSPFSENPSVPTVDTANSSVEYDATGNKLKVNITVKAD